MVNKYVIEWGDTQTQYVVDVVKMIQMFSNQRLQFTSTQMTRREENQIIKILYLY